MGKQHSAPMTTTPYDIVRIIKRIECELAAGLQLDNDAAVTALAGQIERDLIPRIVPDRRYTLTELVENFGYTRGLFYKRHKHLIRKDGRKSFIFGRELLADIEAAPTLAPAVPDVAGGTAAALGAPRRRGRPRRVTVESKPTASGEDAEADEPALQ